ncbi:MAG: septum formation protein Maf [Bacteroidales bacterium]|nr:septum formation protein Maf [Bacteroidales bacterium]
MIDNINKYRLILASASPRRQQLLRDLGLKFDVVVKEYDETFPDYLLGGEEIALYLAKEKIKAFRSEIADNEIVVTADTIVWCNHRVLGKPLDEREATDMIRELSGRTHEVITGVYLYSLRGERTFSDTTKVTFDDLSDDEISYYVKNFGPYDKAGAYGIQEWIGIAACCRIEGSYFNVVGLPVQKLYRALKDLTGNP